jgi:hypothetical protein
MQAQRSIVAAALLLVGALLAPALGTAGDEVEWIADKRGCKVANPIPRPGESITWSGECKNGFAHGEGVLQWFLRGREDDRYTGMLEMGWAEGKGVLTKPDGAKYEGDWKQSMQSGNGRLEWPDGSWYDGQWKAGKPHGQGQYRRPDGKLFMGEWIDGEFEGDLQQEDQADDPNRT